MIRYSLLGVCAALLPSWAQPGPIAGQEIIALVQAALTAEGLPAPDMPAPLRAFPACAHAPQVTAFQDNWSMVELRCNKPAPWKRVLRTHVPDTRAPHREHREARNEAEKTLVVAAARPLVRGQRIAADDVELVPSTRRMGSLGDPNEAIGRRLRVAVMPQQPVLERHLEPGFDIVAGEQIMLQLTHGGIEIGISATALENGWQGDRIRVRAANAQREVRAVVRAPGRAQVHPNIKP